jgi:hypothetical protein
MNDENPAQTIALHEMVTMQRCTMIVSRRRLIVQRHVPIAQPEPSIVQRVETIVQRVETILPLHHVYRLLREVDRDRLLDKANARSDEAIARSADRARRATEAATLTKRFALVPSEPSGAIRRSDTSSSASLRPIGWHDRVNARSCTPDRRSSPRFRRSSATVSASVALHTESPTWSDSFDALVAPIAAPGEAKRHDHNTHRTTRTGGRTAGEMNRFARTLNCTARRIDSISC